MSTHCERIKSHYAGVWKNHPVERRWDRGPVGELPSEFCVLEFPPTKWRGMWTYATCCMSQPRDEACLELHLFSPQRCDSHVELLTVVAHFHRTGARLALGHTINFGRPWIVGSNCDHGLVSLPYLDGPGLENLSCEEDDCPVRCLWLIPITREEREFKKGHGLEELERKLEQSSFDYLDVHRPSVV